MDDVIRCRWGLYLIEKSGGVLVLFDGFVIFFVKFVWREIDFLYICKRQRDIDIYNSPEFEVLFVVSFL